MWDYAGSSSIWEVLPSITGQYFSARTAEATRPQTPTAPTAPPASAAALTMQRQIASFLPLLILIGVGLIAYRALK